MYPSRPPAVLGKRGADVAIKVPRFVRNSTIEDKMRLWPDTFTVKSAPVVPQPPKQQQEGESSDTPMANANPEA
jgi:hypothetical protein